MPHGPVRKLNPDYFRVNLSRLIMQWAAVVLVEIGLVLVLKDD